MNKHDLLNSFFTVNNSYEINKSASFNLFLIVVCIVAILWFFKFYKKQVYLHKNPDANITNKTNLKATEKKEKQFLKMRKFSEKYNINLPGSKFNTYQEYLDNFSQNLDKQVEPKQNIKTLKLIMVVFSAFGLILINSSILSIMKNKPHTIEIIDSNKAVFVKSFGKNQTIYKHEISDIYLKNRSSRSKNTTSYWCNVHLKFYKAPSIEHTLNLNSYESTIRISDKSGNFPECKT